MCALGDEKSPLETGGMLLGYVSDSGEVVVTEIIGPGPNAIHGRFRFLPDADYQQEKLTAHHIQTNGVESYLGDWHTHPRGEPLPSRLDKKTLAKIADTPSSGIEKPVMAILGCREKEWQIKAYRFAGSTRRFLLSTYELTTLLPVLHGPFA